MKLIILSITLILAYSISGYAQIYNLEWAQPFGSGSQEEALRIVTDDDGNLIYTVRYWDSTSVNIGGTMTTEYLNPGTGNLIVKADPNGQGVWYHPYIDDAQLFDIDVHGTDIYTTGFLTNGTMDLDPGPGTVNVTAGITASFCQKFDANGNLVWGKGFEGPGQITAEDLAVDDNGNVYISGEIYNGTIDIDPGPGTVNITPTNRVMFIVKLDVNGDYVWHHAYEGDDISITYVETSSNHVYLYGTYEGTYDFDPGPGVDSETSQGNGDALIHKIDFNGNLIWSKRFGGPTGTDNWDRNSVDNITFDDQENIYMVGYYASNMDVDPGPGTTTIPGFCNDCARIFAAKWTANGEYVWSYYTESSLASGSRLVPNDINLSATQNNVVFGGYVYSYQPLGSIDFDPGVDQFNATVGTHGGSFFIHTDSSGNFFWSGFRENQSIHDFDAMGDTLVYGGSFSDTANIGTSQNPVIVSPTPHSIFPGTFADGMLGKILVDFNGLDAHVFTIPTSHIDSCDATAYAYPIGGIPPYSYEWITQIDSDDLYELDTACYGIHSLLVTDAAGDSAFVDYYITDSSNYYNWSVGTVSDTVYFTHENCSLDYNLPIDSANITLFYFLMNDSLSNGQYYYGEVEYYQSGTSYTFGDTVLVDFSQNVLFFLSIYCPNKINQHIKVVLISTDSGVLDVESTHSALFNVYPNPTRTSFRISDAEYDQGYMTDLSGRIIKKWTAQGDEIFVNDLSSGVYFVSLIKQGQLLGTVKLILE